jgi:hypothetical protein
MAATKIIVTNLAGFISALNTASNQDTTCISIELPGPNVLNLSNTITLPTTLGNTRNQVIIQGNGVTIRPGNIWPGPSIPLMNRGSSVNNTSYIIRDINFEGSNNCNGLILNDCIDSVIENCRFYSVNVGLALYTCNNFTIKNCQTESNSTYGYYIVNSSVGSISNSKFIAPPANNIVSTGYYIFGSNAVSMYDCSSIGIANRHIQFDSNGNTSVNSFSIKNINLDDWANIGIDLKLSTGYVKIDGLNTRFSGIAGVTDKPLINGYTYGVNNVPFPHLYVENVPYLTDAVKFQTTNGVLINCPTVPQGNTVVWSFKEVYTNGGDLFFPGRWVQSLIPYYRYSEVFDESKTIKTNYMKVNTNIIS